MCIRDRLSLEDQALVMLGKLKVPAGLSSTGREEVQARYTGSDGAKCDGCEAQTVVSNQCCERCKYTVCESCSIDRSRGTCYCRDGNFGDPYPSHDDREMHQFGYW
eukprot:TRINITY_DN51091_c0_g1_i1.p2 TRINITY_DN51091_c0_g1~~TRINITY_DN51091_c0_g1_i1.p2  ORF type:complete len:114 (-),score=27.39 TRINITY_DN51091_c0_g1_i1:119-436(-)